MAVCHTHRISSRRTGVAVASRSGRGRGTQDGSGPAGEPGRPDAFQAELAALGFVPSGASRRGGRVATLVFNTHLRFVLHEFDDAVLLSWSFALGEFAEQRGWQLGVSDVSTAELYPQVDVRLPRDVAAVGGEITRVLATLRLDLGDPSL